MNALRSAVRACLGAVAALLVLQGCGTPSVHPIYTPDNLVNDDRMVGSWREESGKTTYTVSEVKDGYRLTIGSKPENKDDKPVNQTLDMKLVQLGSNRFVDVCAAAPDRSAVEDKHGTLFVPTHMFARIVIEGDTAKAYWLKPEWVRATLNDRTPAIAGTPLNDEPHGSVLITSDTPKLQAFLRAHAEDEDAWEKTVLKRVKEPAPK